LKEKYPKGCFAIGITNFDIDLFKLHIVKDFFSKWLSLNPYEAQEALNTARIIIGFKRKV
jgi:hypothetical protein